MAIGGRSLGVKAMHNIYEQFRQLIQSRHRVEADAAATGIARSAVAETVAANYQTCHLNAEQLRALQVWVSEMASAKH